MDVDESELAKLQRQLRIMEGERQAYNMEAREQIRKQEQEIEKLLKEQEELQRVLAASTSLSRHQRDTAEAESLRALLEQRDMLDQEVEKEKHHHKDLQREIANYEQKLAELRKAEVSSQDSRKSEVRRTKKAIQTLEYKLDKALTRFNEQLTKNSRLREDLQTLQIERVRFQQLRSRLEKELQEVRKKIREVAGLSTAAYDASMEAQSKMTMMREKAVKDLAQYNAEMKELERVLAHENNLKEFMSAKCNERSNQAENRQEAGHRMSEQQEQQKTDTGEESLDTLEDVFEKLQIVTGEENVNLIVTRFLQAEDRNLALFNFVNEQNTEVEALMEQIKQMQDEMEHFRVKGLQQEQDHQSSLRDIDEQVKETESKAEDYEGKAGNISGILEQIKTGVNRMFTNLQCDRSAIEDMLGLSTGISENNIMFYLGLVEQKANELLTIQDFVNSKDLEKDYNPKDLAKILLGQNQEVLEHDVTIQPTINSVDYDADESPVADEERPLSQSELRRRLLKGIQREQSSELTVTKPSKHEGGRNSAEEPLI